MKGVWSCHRTKGNLTSTTSTMVLCIYVNPTQVIFTKNRTWQSHSILSAMLIRAQGVYIVKNKNKYFGAFI